MILFQSDWGRSSSVPNYDTTNDSFLKLARLYHSMGVKNSVFLLAILQIKLIGVDPHSDNLTSEQKLLIGTECLMNPWFYFRECVRIPGVSANVPIKFKANRGNISLIWCFFNHIDYALIQPRQTGKSVSTDTLMCWLLFIGCINTTINMITKDNDLRTKNVERLKKIRDLLPAYLIPRDKKDPDNQSELKCVAKGNHYQTGVSQPNETAANKLGRGLTSPITHFDEAPFINHIGVTLPAALASGNAARDEAELYNRPYGNIFTTTAGKKDDRDGAYMYDMISGGASWDEAFFDCADAADLLRMIKMNMTGRKIMINGTFSHRQLGYTDEWLYKKMAEANASGDAADRDFFNVWTSGTQSSPLSPKLNEKIRKSEKEVKYKMITDSGFIVKWYLDEIALADRMRNSKIIMGLDASDGIGRDALGIVLLDAYDLSVLGVLKTNETNLILFSEFITELMVRFENIILIPERKSSAQTIIDLLLLRLPAVGIDPFKRIYNIVVNEQGTRQDDYKAICKDIARRNRAFYEHYKSYFGFVTTGASRDVLYKSVLQNAAKVAGHLVNDKELSSEIRGLVVKNGRIDHSTGSHDDLVISWMLCHWLLTHGTNLHFYGIDTAKMTAAFDEGEHAELTIEQRRDMEEQKTLMAELDEVAKAMDEADNDIQAMKLEHRLKVIYMRLKPNEKNAISIDALVKEANDKRKMKRRLSRQAMEDFDINRAWGGSSRREQRKVNAYH